MKTRATMMNATDSSNDGRGDFFSCLVFGCNVLVQLRSRSGHQRRYMCLYRVRSKAVPW